MQFYNLKTRSHVDVPDSEVRKVKMTRQTKTGEQVRYAMTAQHEGSKLFKFVNEADYNSSSVQEGEAAGGDAADGGKQTGAKKKGK